MIDGGIGVEATALTRLRKKIILASFRITKGLIFVFKCYLLTFIILEH